jgi:hypothetical protein
MPKSIAIYVSDNIKLEHQVDTLEELYETYMALWKKGSKQMHIYASSKRKIVGLSLPVLCTFITLDTDEEYELFNKWTTEGKS